MNFFVQRVFFTAVLIPSIAFANHGPETSGGSTGVKSAGTINQGQLKLVIREDVTKYKSIGIEEEQEIAGHEGSFHSINRAFLTSFDISYGLMEDFEIGADIGWYAAREFRDFTSHEGFFTKHLDDSDESNFALADPEGSTDLTIHGKYGIVSTHDHCFSLIGGIIFPIGKDDERLSSGEVIEPSSQPGTGQYGYKMGLAYSRSLTSHASFDMSTIYSLRESRDSFTIGDRADSGLALAYRLTDSHHDFPQVSLFGELSHAWLGKDEKHGEVDNNSGGNAVFLSPGFRIRINDKVGISLFPSFPIIQDLNGHQVETKLKVAAVLTLLL